MSGDLHIRTELPRFIHSFENIWIPMRDGARLAARVWLPKDADEAQWGQLMR